jgi:hypothetical protein
VHLVAIRAGDDHESNSPGTVHFVVKVNENKAEIAMRQESTIRLTSVTGCAPPCRLVQVTAVPTVIARDAGAKTNPSTVGVSASRLVGQLVDCEKRKSHSADDHQDVCACFFGAA